MSIQSKQDMDTLNLSATKSMFNAIIQPDQRECRRDVSHSIACMLRGISVHNMLVDETVSLVTQCVSGQLAVLFVTLPRGVIAMSPLNLPIGKDYSAAWTIHHWAAGVAHRIAPF